MKAGFTRIGRLTIPLSVLGAALLAISCGLMGQGEGDYSAHPERRMQFDSVCTDWSCTENKWFLGENLKTGPSRQREPYTPHLSPIVSGTDCGASVRLSNGTTIAYMADSETNDRHDWGFPSPTRCGAGSECNDPIMIIDRNDTNPADGVNARLVLDGADPSRYFAPLTIPGVNQTGHSVVVIDTPFTYATGADLGLITVQVPVGDGGTTGDGGAPVIDAGTTTSTIANVYLWFATEITATDGRSFLACSPDGLEFHNCEGSASDEARLFSTDKFVLVNPVSVGNDVWSSMAAACTSTSDSNHASPLCDLREKLLSDAPSEQLSGMLLFGARGGPQGQNPGVSGYRESPLYLAYLQLTTGNVWYFTGSSWSRDNESDAQPVLHEGLASAAADRKLYWFGEFSVRLVVTGGKPYLVMLSNHSNITNDDLHDLSILYRTASLFEPNLWTPPLQTCARGYGPYIIDQYTRVSSGKLIVYHMIQGWNGTEPGDRDHEAYGVFTTQLRLRNDTKCTAPSWPPP